jgi:predicted nucleotidyltransferase component of viral defense system
MITMEELREKARIKGLSLGHAEKDYLLDLVLLSVSRSTKNELVFKGGTCLNKFYKIDRFSEDADFTAVMDIDMEELTRKVISDMKLFSINCFLHKKKAPFNSILTTLRCEGPLFRGTPQTYATVRIDVNLKSSIDLEPEVLGYSSLYSDIPVFSLLVMQEKEILAEKVRAVLTRNKARDLYDLWYLLGKKTGIGNKIISKKLEYYNMEFVYEEFITAVNKKKALWEKELEPLVSNVPDFSAVKKAALSAARKWKAGKR